MMSLLGASALAVAAGCVFAELYGYWLHVLLHSNRIEFLSRDHMIHHLVVYGPRTAQQRPAPYQRSTVGRPHILDIGLEWLVPVGLVVLLWILIFSACHVRALPQALFLGTAIGWSLFMFNYIHDATHIQGFWLERSPLKGPFLTVRRRHILHHSQLDDQGRMATNYGICFFLCDRLFGTFRDRPQPFNAQGYDAALVRYRYIFPARP